MLFYQYNWPGNVRELENEIEFALTLAGEDREITEEYISEKIKESRKEDSTAKQGGRTLKEKERQEVIKALRSTGGNRSQAARILGLSRQGLLNKIARYEIKL